MKSSNKDNRDVRALIEILDATLLPELSDPLRAYMNSHKQEATSLFSAAAFILYQSKGASLTFEDLNVLTKNPVEQESLISKFKQERQHKTLQATQAINNTHQTYSSKFFQNHEKDFLIEHRHDNPVLQHEYDKEFGLVLKTS